MSKTNKKRPIYVLDTNVLLYNPRAVFAFPDADVIIPDIVLGELDKVKTSRADRELRYRSREISRILFELSEHGKLTDGVPFGKNSVIRVTGFDPAKGTPELFGSKNSDDRILSIVHQIKRESNGRPVTIVTNDVNMLLKAQTIEIKVEHPGEEFAYSGVKRAIFWLRARKKTIWSSLAVATVIIALVFLPQIKTHLGIGTSLPEGPPELLQQLRDYQTSVKTLEAQMDTYEAMLTRNPKDLEALIGVGNTYFEFGELNRDFKSLQQKTVEYQNKAIKYYKKALEVDPKKSSVRTDMAIAYYNLGMHDIAIKELEKVISTDKDFYQAYYNLGVILYEGKNDQEKAKEQFQKVVELSPQGSRFAYDARSFISQIDAHLKIHSKGR